MSRTAALRIRRLLDEADLGNFPRSALFYVSRSDVEAVLEDYLRLVDGPLKMESGRAQEPASVTSRED